MCFKSKPQKKDLLNESRMTVESNSRVLQSCAALVDDTGLKNKIEIVCDRVKYMSPTCDIRATQLDKRIGTLAGDLKIALTKNAPKYFLEGSMIIDEINKIIVERNGFI